MATVTCTGPSVMPASEGQEGRVIHVTMKPTEAEQKQELAVVSGRAAGATLAGVAGPLVSELCTPEMVSACVSPLPSPFPVDSDVGKDEIVFARRTVSTQAEIEARSEDVQALKTVARRLVQESQRLIVEANVEELQKILACATQSYQRAWTASDQAGADSQVLWSQSPGVLSILAKQVCDANSLCTLFESVRDDLQDELRNFPSTEPVEEELALASAQSQVIAPTTVSSEAGLMVEVGEPSGTLLLPDNVKLEDGAPWRFSVDEVVISKSPAKFAPARRTVAPETIQVAVVAKASQDEAIADPFAIGVEDTLSGPFPTIPMPLAKASGSSQSVDRSGRFGIEPTDRISSRAAGSPPGLPPARLDADTPVLEKLHHGSTFVSPSHDGKRSIDLQAPKGAQSVDFMSRLESEDTYTVPSPLIHVAHTFTKDLPSQNLVNIPGASALASNKIACGAASPIFKGDVGELLEKPSRNEGVFSLASEPVELVLDICTMTACCLDDSVVEDTPGGCRSATHSLDVGEMTGGFLPIVARAAYEPSSFDMPSPIFLEAGADRPFGEKASHHANNECAKEVGGCCDFSMDTSAADVIEPQHSAKLSSDDVGSGAIGDDARKLSSWDATPKAFFDASGTPKAFVGLGEFFFSEPQSDTPKAFFDASGTPKAFVGLGEFFFTEPKNDSVPTSPGVADTTLCSASVDDAQARDVDSELELSSLVKIQDQIVRVLSDDEEHMGSPTSISPTSPTMKNTIEADAAMPIAGTGPAVGSQVCLHVYDVSQHAYVQWFNTVFAHRFSPLKFGGIFHIGVVVHGKEWIFGHCPNGSGVAAVMPKSYQEHHFRETVQMSYTQVSFDEFYALIAEFRDAYHGQTYHLLRRNCCHFADELCQRLGVGPIPTWLYRLASVVDSSSHVVSSIGDQAGVLHFSRSVVEFPQKASAAAITCGAGATALPAGIQHSGTVGVTPKNFSEKEARSPVPSIEDGVSIKNLKLASSDVIDSNDHLRCL